MLCKGRGQRAATHLREPEGIHEAVPAYQSVLSPQIRFESAAKAQGIPACRCAALSSTFKSVLL